MANPNKPGNPGGPINPESKKWANLESASHTPEKKSRSNPLTDAFTISGEDKQAIETKVRQANPRAPSEQFVKQEIGKAYLGLITDRIAALTPRPADFAGDHGRDPERCQAAQAKEAAIRRNYEKQIKPADLAEEDFYNHAFESLVYKFAQDGLFTRDRKPASAIITSDFDDFINAGRGEQAHAVDCAIAIPYKVKTADGQEKVKHFPLAFACTTAAENGANSKSKRSTAAEKMAKYPDDGFAKVEFATLGQTGRRLGELELPAFVLAVERGTLREMATKGKFEANDKLRISFASQILAQAQARLLHFRSIAPGPNNSIDRGQLNAKERYRLDQLFKAREIFQGILNDSTLPHHPFDRPGMLVVEAARAASDRYARQTPDFQKAG